MTTNTTTRRAVLATAAAAPLLPVGVHAANADSDPAVAAYRRWIDATRARSAHRTPLDWDEDPHADALERAFNEATWALIEAPARTPAGILAKFHLFALLSGRAEDLSIDNTDVDAFDFAPLKWSDGRDEQAARALLRDLRGMGA